ncbi:hypothetical protein HanXRQr2_Chr03g0092671 [Helianthus annuus]|uniref:Uncharacterized protein n=1 Tax=Helianthus annuus TaxID=4232 RepID=A0A9K3JCC6_HELAN|nr:hypothetical protein HanXRQr2_Chr03g0092671 [Helianthus annuus]
MSYCNQVFELYFLGYNKSSWRVIPLVFVLFGLIIDWDLNWYQSQVQSSKSNAYSRSTAKENRNRITVLKDL